MSKGPWPSRVVWPRLYGNCAEVITYASFFQKFACLSQQVPGDEAEPVYTEICNNVMEVSAVKDIFDDVMDVASAVTSLDSNANVQDQDQVSY